MSKAKSFPTRQLALDAMLCALCAVLGYLAIDLQSVKLTFEAVPVLLAGLLFGPLDGLAVGGVGTLLYQFLRYGVSPTTPLWVLPYLLCGLLVGFYARRRRFDLSRRQILIAVMGGELLVTILNTPVIYLDSVLFGYYYPGIVTAQLALRLVVCLAKGAAFGALFPSLIRRLHPAVERRSDS